MILFVAGLSVAVTLAVGEDKERLPGSESGIDSALAKAQIVVIARANHVGLPIMGGSAGSTYDAVDLHPSRMLKGGAAPQHLRSGHFLVRSFLNKPGEVPPSGGEDYIFFIERRGPDSFRCIKMMRSSKENVDRVIAAQRKEIRLPGSSVGTFAAAERASIIVVGKLTGLKELRSSPPGSGDIVSTKVEVIRTLKGDLGGDHSPDFKLVRGPAESAERTPAAGSDYIFFAENVEGGTLNWFKILPADDENLDEAFRAATYPK